MKFRIIRHLETGLYKPQIFSEGEYLDLWIYEDITKHPAEYITHELAEQYCLTVSKLQSMGYEFISEFETEE